ncbi:/ / SIR2-like domain protein / 204864:205886 Forward [Candidatus Hepatoplasma crinochetorum]|uniref:/ / SIR2-like domain protein / 204864:205886 Forward n=1 Tax=Candidatus Hepatoplasma crinochetorum TaxID=295596 RepID=A0A0G7ZMA7_9MOLU|nr:/ / SIR2-like domain protein / 204864:205886 Forward [Candidatus Hepatoplasma crinochetorum]
MNLEENKLDFSREKEIYNEDALFRTVEKYFGIDKLYSYNLSFLIGNDFFKLVEGYNYEDFYQKLKKTKSYRRKKATIKNLDKLSKKIEAEFDINFTEGLLQLNKKKKYFDFTDKSKNIKDLYYPFAKIINNYLENSFNNEINILTIDFSNFFENLFTPSRFELKKYNFYQTNEDELSKKINLYKIFGDIEDPKEIKLPKELKKNYLPFFAFDQLRIFTNKVNQKNSVLVVFGYDFSDQYLNNLLLNLKDNQIIKILLLVDNQNKNKEIIYQFLQYQKIFLIKFINYEDKNYLSNLEDILYSKLDFNLKNNIKDNNKENKEKGKSKKRNSIKKGKSKKDE